MTICIRYVDVTTWVMREDFLGFIEMVSTTGAIIKNTIQQKLVSIGLKMENIRGQGYDGGSNMSGRINGVQALILKEQPLAFYTHCFKPLPKFMLIQSMQNIYNKKYEWNYFYSFNFFFCFCKTC